MLPQLQYNEIKTGDSYTLKKVITSEMVETFANLTGDYNPVHMDDDYCLKQGLGFKTVHGLLSVSFISEFVGMYLPGNGSVCLSHNFDFIAPVRVNDTLDIVGTVIKKNDDNALKLNILVIKFQIFNQLGKIVVRGTSKVSVQ